jgi:hypothetical protein
MNAMDVKGLDATWPTSWSLSHISFDLSSPIFYPLPRSSTDNWQLITDYF